MGFKNWIKNVFKRPKRELKAEVLVLENKVLDVMKSKELKEMLDHEMKKVIVDALNRRINFPVLNEKAEAWLIGQVYDKLKNVVISFVKKKLLEETGGK